ncbi:hypothetical protein CONLIGDRAFT_679391 [Coniochaeta ligniaria NRRL 30616]|uniref:Uncharacterized protein n=1 Tax=Coniochaeta ligniaria NRRL 30616 TaxID=1408157 RepID=A0A1J7JMS7_9PEZI|nr:hypothetical protein CONLIGDRAFT_679391 [Coniochaeta ligniaria NRRL 30616]
MRRSLSLIVDLIADLTVAILLTLSTIKLFILLNNIWPWAFDSICAEYCQSDSVACDCLDYYIAFHCDAVNGLDERELFKEIASLWKQYWNKRQPEQLVDERQ